MSLEQTHVSHIVSEMQEPIQLPVDPAVPIERVAIPVEFADDESNVIPFPMHRVRREEPIYQDDFIDSDTSVDSDEAEHIAFLASELAVRESIEETQNDITREYIRQASFHQDPRDRRAARRSDNNFERGLANIDVARSTDQSPLQKRREDAVFAVKNSGRTRSHN